MIGTCQGGNGDSPWWEGIPVAWRSVQLVGERCALVGAGRCDHTRPDIHLLSRALREPSQKIELGFGPPASKQTLCSLGHGRLIRL